MVINIWGKYQLANFPIGQKIIIAAPIEKEIKIADVPKKVRFISKVRDLNELFDDVSFLSKRSNFITKNFSDR